MKYEDIKFEQIKELIPENVELYYIDYRDDLNGHGEIFEQCLEKGNSDPLFEESMNWFIDMESTQYYLDEIKSDLQNHFELNDDDVEELMYEFSDDIRQVLWDRDTSTPLRDLLKNTSAIPVRISLYSNFDCINSHFFEGGYSYIESYFGDVVNALNLNPAKVKQLFTEHGIEMTGRFPNYHWRNGKELISYADFLVENLNRCAPANLFTVIATIDPTEFYNMQSMNKIVIPQGNVCGFYSSMYGGGSMFDAKLQNDLVIDLTEHGKSKYDCFGLNIDNNGDYSLQSVYGVDSDFFGDSLTVRN